MTDCVSVMRVNWTSVGSMYLGREMPLLFLLFSNLHSSKTESEDDKTILPFLSVSPPGHVRSRASLLDDII